MEIQYFGGTALKLSTKKAQIVVDPTQEVAAIKIDTKKASYVLETQESRAKVGEGIFLINSPGEYEFEDSSVKGIAAQPFQGSTGDSSATMYRVSSSEASVFVAGTINEKLSEDQLEAIGVVDVMIVPVGGNGYSTDASGAATLVRAVEPKVVIPVFYAEDGVKYQVSPAGLEAFTKELGAPVEDAVEKLKLKGLPEQLTVQPIKAS